MRRDWSYANGTSQKIGLMICSRCSKPITGEYRNREREYDYVLEHRECCPEDPRWQVIDRDREKVRTDCATMLAEAKAFRDKWDVSDLDDLINGLEP